MAELYALSSFMAQVFGPMMLVSLVMMYIMVTRATGKRPGPREVVLAYVRYNVEKKRHAGILTYLLIISFLMFLLSVIGLLTSYLLK